MNYAVDERVLAYDRKGRTGIHNWMIGINASDSDGGISMYRVRGTEEEVRQHLMAIINEDREEIESLGRESWDYGTESIEEIEKDVGKLYGFGVYDDFHIDYTAVIEKEPEILAK